MCQGILGLLGAELFVQKPTVISQKSDQACPH